MSKHRIQLPDSLTTWVDNHLPELGGIGSVSIIGCTRLPFEWIAGRNSQPSGMTLFSRVYIRDTLLPIDVRDFGILEVLFHEIVHVIQFRRMPLRHSFVYAYHLMRTGYWDHPMEQEARTRSSQLAWQFLEAPAP